jgi:hypothetical protein
MKMFTGSPDEIEKRVQKFMSREKRQYVGKHEELEATAR